MPLPSAPTSNTTTDADTPSLPEDTIDDILYLARANEPAELLSTIHAAAESSGRAPHAILGAAVDADSGNTALHMAAANGHTGKRGPPSA
jgi:hypothetical protein